MLRNFISANPTNKGGKTKRAFSRLIGVDGTVWILDGYECNEVAGC